MDLNTILTIIAAILVSILLVLSFVFKLPKIEITKK